MRRSAGLLPPETPGGRWRVEEKPSSNAAWNAADLTADSDFYSQNAPNQSLAYDFGDRRAGLSHYSIRSRDNGSPGDHNLRSWVIEGSNNGSGWIAVDRREDDSSLNDKNMIQLFDVRKVSPAFRFVRLRQIGPNHGSNHYLAISGFELFGSLNKA